MKKIWAVFIAGFIFIGMGIASLFFVNTYMTKGLQKTAYCFFSEYYSGDDENIELRMYFTLHNGTSFKIDSFKSEINIYGTSNLLRSTDYEYKTNSNTGTKQENIIVNIRYQMPITEEAPYSAWLTIKSYKVNNFLANLISSIVVLLGIAMLYLSKKWQHLHNIKQLETK